MVAMAWDSPGWDEFSGVVVGKERRIVVASSAPVRWYGVVCAEIRDGGFRDSLGRVW